MAASSGASVVEHSVEIDAPVSTVFDYVGDFSKTPTWFYGLTRIEPVSGPERGVGAVYDGVVKLGVTLTSRLECTAYDADTFIELTSVKGIKNHQRWRFAALGEDRTRLDVHIDYELPGGLAGRAVASAVKPLIGVAVTQSSAALKRNVEAL
ncbi:SRPBCC family protein [Nocardioides sp.]|uniref:SRPBCC family protein n=1 Tax=Nocardioides sp. TaxID=35761 RepID=UPI0035186266